MTGDERLTRIQQAKTQNELDQALNGYREEVIATHPDLRGNYAFNLALERKQYFHALCDVKRASRGVWTANYQDVIRVLKKAADKQFIFQDI